MDIFKNINNKNKKKLLKLLEANTLFFKQNNTILSNFRTEDSIGIIVKGCIQIVRTDYNGNKTIFEELTDNDIFGTFISSLKNKENEIITKEDSVIITIDFDRIINTEENKDYFTQFVKNLFEILTNKVQKKNERIEILTRRTTRNKLLEYFRISAKTHGSRYVYLPFSFTDLADYLSVDRSAMSRELKYLKEEGFIEVKGKRITLLY